MCFSLETGNEAKGKIGKWLEKEKETERHSYLNEIINNEKKEVDWRSH